MIIQEFRWKNTCQPTNQPIFLSYFFVNPFISYKYRRINPPTDRMWHKVNFLRSKAGLNLEFTFLWYVAEPWQKNLAYPIIWP